MTSPDEVTGIGPSTNPKDNLGQGIFCLVTAVLGCVLGYVYLGEDQTAILEGLLLGLLFGGFWSGAVLMLLGIYRKIQSR